MTIYIFKLSGIFMNLINMKVKKDKIDPPSSLHILINREDDISEAILIKHQKQIHAYIKMVCTHLENLKQEIYNTIDAGDLDLQELFSPLNIIVPIEEAQGFITERAVDILSAPIRSGVPNAAGFPEKPSDFLEKAYTLQRGNIKNRNQCYIAVGMLLSHHCEEKSDELHPSMQQRVLNDFGKMAAAINSALSKLYKLEDDLNDNQIPLDIIGLSLRLLPTYIETVLGVAEESKIVELIPNQTFVPWILSELTDLARDFLFLFSKKLGQQELQYRNRFFNIYERYKIEAQNPANLDVEDILEPLLP
jgi:hypothetical protein